MQISDRERRRRLTRRHHLGRTASTGLDAVRAVAAFHSTDPVTPYLGMWARVPAFDTDQLDNLLGKSKKLWRMHAMRRTLFLVPADEAAVFEAGAARDIARKERRRLVGWLEAEMEPADIGPWLDKVSAGVIEVLRHDELRTQEITQAVPEIDRKIRVGAGKWMAETPVSSRLLFLLAMEGHIVRTRPAGSWRSSQYHWTAASTWWETTMEPMEEQEGRFALARRYLAGHGPATLTDLRWWTGWTVGNARMALAELGAVAVELDSGDEGYVLVDDLTSEEEPATAVTFLPGLDPTPMGWKHRDWYLGPHTDLLFDANGNVGPTVWTDGRVVGGWGQRPDGCVVHELLEDVTGKEAGRIAEEASALERWLDGEVVSIRFKTPLERKLAAS